MGKLDGKVALITGAGSGIGRATATLFAKEGAEVVVVDCAEGQGRETVKMIKDAGGDAVFVSADVSKSSDVQKMIDAAVDTYGRLDILFNNAGIQGPMGPLADIPEDGWDSVMNVNLKGAFLGSKYAIPVMLRQGGGAIINTSSCQGIGTVPNMAPYSVSKAGIIHLTKTTALDYAAQNIRANCICPGTIQTPMSAPYIQALRTQAFLQGRVGQPEEIAHVALFLASDDSSYVTAQAIAVDGGWISAAMPLLGA